MEKKIIFFAGILGLISVILSALSAHALKSMLNNNSMTESFNIATNFLLIHSIVAILAAILYKQFAINLFYWSGWVFVIGSIIFAFPIFIKSFNITQAISAITPVGGTISMVGWLLLIIAALKIKY